MESRQPIGTLSRVDSKRPHPTDQIQPLDTSSGPLKVLYVMGAGRSGSTILGVALGNCDGFFFAGELEAWLRRSAIPNFPGTDREEFWAAIQRAMGDPRDLYGEFLWRYLEHSCAIFRPRRRSVIRDMRSRYREVSERLYREIAALSQHSVIVDTSHYPLRARELATIDGIELYLLYLVRAPENVVASFQKTDVAQDPKPLLATNAYLWLTTLICTYTYFRFPRDRRVFIRYEQFIANPHKVIGRILDMSRSRSAVPDFEALSTGIGFQGNRILRAKTIHLDRRGDSVPEPSALTRLLQLPWLMVFRLIDRVSSGSNRAKRTP